MTDLRYKVPLSCDIVSPSKIIREMNKSTTRLDYTGMEYPL